MSELIEAIANGADTNRERWPRPLAQLVEAVEAAFCREGFEPSKLMADIAVVTWAETFGGQRIRLPKPEIVRIAVRDARIWEEFDGRNQIVLAKKYRLSVEQLYRIFRRQRAIGRMRRDQELGRWSGG